MLVLYIVDIVAVVIELEVSVMLQSTNVVVNVIHATVNLMVFVVYSMALESPVTAAVELESVQGIYEMVVVTFVSVYLIAMIQDSPGTKLG